MIIITRNNKLIIRMFRCKNTWQLSTTFTIVIIVIIVIKTTPTLSSIRRMFQVRKHLAMINHRHRLKRFSEGFFTMTNPRKSALCCLDVKHSHHTTVSEATRRSPYFSNLPNLQVIFLPNLSPKSFQKNAIITLKAY